MNAIDASRGPIGAAPELTDAERAAAIREKVAELLGPAIVYVNTQGKLGYVVDFACARTVPDDLKLTDVRIHKVL